LEADDVVLTYNSTVKELRDVALTNPLAVKTLSVTLVPDVYAIRLLPTYKATSDGSELMNTTLPVIR
jgi:hypothetical protein